MAEIDWSIRVPVKPWACKRGHQFQSAFPYLTVRGVGGKDAMSGPICLLCVLDFLNREFPAFEVGKE